jgi:hypothetical protein
LVQRKWGAISTFTTLEFVAKRAAENGLGSWWAALELPPDVQIEENHPLRLGRHVSICGETPEQLLSYVAEVGEFEFEEGVDS